MDPAPPPSAEDRPSHRPVHKTHPLPGRPPPPKRVAKGYASTDLRTRQLLSGSIIDKLAVPPRLRDFAIPEVQQYSRWTVRYGNMQVNEDGLDENESNPEKIHQAIKHARRGNISKSTKVWRYFETVPEGTFAFILFRSLKLIPLIPSYYPLSSRHLRGSCSGRHGW